MLKGLLISIFLTAFCAQAQAGATSAAGGFMFGYALGGTGTTGGTPLPSTKDTIYQAPAEVLKSVQNVLSVKITSAKTCGPQVGGYQPSVPPPNENYSLGELFNMATNNSAYNKTVLKIDRIINYNCAIFWFSYI